MTSAFILAGVVGISPLFAAAKKAEEEQRRLVGELRDALGQVKTLTGIIPICAHCKKVRDDQGFWKRVEAYVAEHSDAAFSHGICPDCLEKLVPEEPEEPR